MHKDLEPAKRVLRSFLADIDNVKAFRKQISFPMDATSFTIKDRMPEFDSTVLAQTPDSLWEEEDAYMWLYAEAWKFRALMHPPKSQIIPEYYSQAACPIYEQWRREKKEVFYRKCIQIPQPNEKISLLSYLQELASAISESNEHRDVWIESLRSFLQFLREDTKLVEKGPLEVLFPSKESCKGMELRPGYRLQRNRKGKGYHKVETRHILRSIENTVYPIDIFAEAEILMNLSNVVLYGRPNSQYSAAVALGFAWLCHAVACYRLVTREELVFTTEIDSFRPILDSRP